MVPGVTRLVTCSALVLLLRPRLESATDRPGHAFTPVWPMQACTKDASRCVGSTVPGRGAGSLVFATPQQLTGSTWPQQQGFTTHVLRRLWGGNDGETSELERLREENKELKGRLRQQEGSGGGGGGVGGGGGEGPVKKLSEMFSNLIGRGDKAREKSSRSGLAAPMGSLPGALGLAGSLLKPLFGMVGGMLQAAQGDVGAVTEAARVAILRSGRLGSRVECGQIFSQSYASMNINGQQTTQVRLQFQVQGERGTGMASCDASLGPDSRVSFRDLRLDGSPIDVSTGDSGASSVIDVDR